MARRAAGGRAGAASGRADGPTKRNRSPAKAVVAAAAVVAAGRTADDDGDGEAAGVGIVGAGVVAVGREVYASRILRRRRWPKPPTSKSLDWDPML